MRLRVIEQWSESTSLSLLEAIASILRDASARCVAMEPDRTHVLQDADLAAPSVVGKMLRSVAQRDPAFRAWLGVRAPRASEQSDLDSLDWVEIEDCWLQWLAAEMPAGGADDLVDARGVSAYRDDADLPSRLARLVAMSAQSALAQLSSMREARTSLSRMARDLAYDMAYGLSHELNNPLANIASRARLLAEEEPSERKRQLLSSIVDQAMRGCEMVADLMLIARPPSSERSPTDLNELIRYLTDQARPWANARGLQLDVSLLPNSVFVMTNAAAAREALWALLRNALEAARHKIAITLCISRGQRRETAEPICSAESVGSAIDNDRKAQLVDFHIVSISDDGTGLSSHALEHAFHPYFSGREAGRGLGVGLSKADRLARLDGGYVKIENLSVGGCRAIVAWPCTVMGFDHDVVKDATAV